MAKPRRPTLDLDQIRMKLTKMRRDCESDFCNAINRLRTRAWMRAACRISDMSAYQLGKLIVLENGNTAARDFVRYEKGERNPVDPPKGIGIIGKVEEHAKGAASWLQHPLWEALRFRDCLGEEQVLRYVLQLDEPTRKLVIREIEVVHEGSKLQLPYVFCDESVAKELVKLGSFDALAAAVLLVRQYEAIRGGGLRPLAIWIFHQLRPAIGSVPEVSPFVDELFDVVHLSCPFWQYEPEGNLAERRVWYCEVQLHSKPDEPRQTGGAGQEDSQQARPRRDEV